MGLVKVKVDRILVYSSYQSKCMGADEIRPQSGQCYNYWGGMGMMIVESVDTLWIMGLSKEYEEAKQWIENKLDYHLNHFTSVFETIIRAIGGLLSAYGLTGEDIYKEKAIDLADRLIKSKIGAFPKVAIY